MTSQIPDLWWSPSMARFLSRHEDRDDEHLVWVWHGHHESLRHFLGTGLDSNPPLPDDAVQLVPDRSITDLEQELYNRAVTAEAERDAILPRLAELAKQAGKLRTAEWLRTCATLPPSEWPPAPAYKGPMVPAAELEEAQRSASFWQGQAERWEREHQSAVLPYTTKLESERDALQARIDEHEGILAAIWLYVKWRYVTKQLTTEQKNLWADAVERVSERDHPGEGAKADRWWSAALQGDQPTERETRCMNGPAKQHTLRMVEILKALKAASADGALPGELDDQASFTQLARAIVDHWPTGEVDRG